MPLAGDSIAGYNVNMEISKSRISLIHSLGQRKFRRRHGLFVAEGAKCVADTIDFFRIKWLCATHEWVESNEALVRTLPDGVLLEATDRHMGQLSSLSSPPQVAAVYEIPDECKAEPEDGRLYLVLDGIQDPGNLGTLVRTADWFGIDTVFASNDTADIYNAKAVQATMGAIGRVRIVYCDVAGLLGSHPGIPAYGTFLDGDDIFTASLDKPGFIVLGNEGKGIGAAVRNLVTERLLIPPALPESHGESLNVAAAGAIVMAMFRRIHSLA